MDHFGEKNWSICSTTREQDVDDDSGGTKNSRSKNVVSRGRNDVSNEKRFWDIENESRRL